MKNENFVCPVLFVFCIYFMLFYVFLCFFMLFYAFLQVFGGFPELFFCIIGGKKRAVHQKRVFYLSHPFTGAYGKPFHNVLTRAFKLVFAERNIFSLHFFQERPPPFGRIDSAFYYAGAVNICFAHIGKGKTPFVSEADKGFSQSTVFRGIVYIIHVISDKKDRFVDGFAVIMKFI